MQAKFFVFSAICALVCGNPAAAQEQALPLVYSAPSDEAIAWNTVRGQTLYRYDQAAWHSTDMFLAAYDEATLGQYMRGYVIVPDAQNSDLLHAIYFGDFGQGLVEVARYSVEGGEVTGGGFLPADARPALSAQAAQLAAARQAAVQVAVQMQLVFCANAAANAIPIPDEDEADKVDVYLLTPMTSTDSYPLGGHYRFTVQAPAQVTQLHALEEGCPIALVPEIPDNAEALVLTTIPFTRAAEPSEIHVLASYFRPVPLFVETPRSNSVWVVDQGTIRTAGEGDMIDVEDGAAQP